MTSLHEFGMLASTPPWMLFAAVSLGLFVVMVIVSVMVALLTRRRMGTTVALGLVFIPAILGGAAFFTYGLGPPGRRWVHRNVLRVPPAAKDIVDARRGSGARAHVQTDRTYVEARDADVEDQERTVAELERAAEELDAEVAAQERDVESRHPHAPAPPRAPVAHVTVDAPRPPQPPIERRVLWTALSGALIAAFLGVGYVALDAGTRGQFTWSLRLLTALTFALLWALTATLW